MFVVVRLPIVYLSKTLLIIYIYMIKTVSLSTTENQENWQFVPKNSFWLTEIIIVAVSFC